MSVVSAASIRPLFRSGIDANGRELMLACGYVNDRYGYMVCVDRTTDASFPQYECIAFHEKVSEATYNEAISDLIARGTAHKR